MSVVQYPLAVAWQYWERLQERTQSVAALFSRNPLADFVPGISDLDLRLVTDGVPAGGWPALAEAVADVHHDMVSTGREFVAAARAPAGRLRDPRRSPGSASASSRDAPVAAVRR